MAMTDCGTNVKSVRETEISVEMGRLNSNIELAHQDFESLKARLQPIRTSKPTACCEKDNKAPGKLCPLAEQISAQANMVYLLLEGIRTLKDELEV